MPTSRNAKGVDLVIYSEDTKRVLKIQVKSSTKREAINFGNKAEIFSDFFVIVTEVYAKPRTFILRGSDIEPRLTQHKENRWLEIKDYKKDEFLEKWKNIGCGWNDTTKCTTIQKYIVDTEV